MPKRHGRRRAHRETVESKLPIAEPLQDGLHASRSRRPFWRERILRIALAILAPALFLGVVELGLRLAGYGYPTSYWIESRDGKSYLSNPRFSWRFLGPEQSREPIPAVVSSEKPAGSYRIVVFGSSAAQGFPNPVFSFARILEAMLNDLYPDTRFEVVNTGMTAINSHAVLGVVRDSRHLAADLYVVYMGNNEVVGPFGPGTVFAGYQPSRRLIRAGLGLRAMRLGQLIANLLRAWGRRTTTQSWGGMEMLAANRVTADDPRLATTYASFRSNLQDICGEARETGAKIILSTVVTNLKDLPPFASVHKAELTEQQKTAWEKAYTEGNALAQSGKLNEATQRYQVAATIDDGYADLHFKMGHCHRALNAFDQARQQCVRARDLDALRFRADSRVNDVIREVAKASGASLVDAEEYVRGPDKNSLAGDDLLYEHVHLTFEGSHAVAAALLGEINRLLPPTIRKKDDSPLPSIERCAALTLFTALSRHSDTMQIRQVTRRPPFAKETDQAVSAKCRTLKTQLTEEDGRRTFEAYRQRVEQRPDDLLAGRVFAGMLRMTGQLNEAVQQYQRVLARYPDSAVIRSDLGQTLYAGNRTTEAIEQARRVLTLNPYAENAWTLLGLAHGKLGELKPAELALRKAVAMQPRSAEARAALAQAFLAWGRPTEAEQHFLAAVEIDAEIAQYHFGLGMARYRHGDLEQALESISRAAEMAGDNASYFLQAAQVAYLSRKTDLARAHYRRAVSIDPLAANRDPDLRQLLVDPNR